MSNQSTAKPPKAMLIKGWAVLTVVNGVPTLIKGSNVASIAKGGAGRVVLTMQPGTCDVDDCPLTNNTPNGLGLGFLSMAEVTATDQITVYTVTSLVLGPVDIGAGRIFVAVI